MFLLSSRYILRAHLGPFLFGFCTVVFLFLMQFMMNYLDILLGKGLSVNVILQFITYNLPWMIVWGMPMGVLFSTLMGYGNLAANYEITILKASGAGLLRLMFPILIAGIVVSVFLFWFNDQVLPRSNHRAKTLMADIKRTKPTFALQQGQFAGELNGLSILARELDSATGVMRHVTIYDYSKPGGLNIVNADSGAIGFNNEMDRMLLKLYKGEVHQISNTSARNNKIIDFNEYIIKMNVDGYGFARSGEDPMSRGQRELSIKELAEIRDRNQKAADVIHGQIEKKIRHELDDNLFKANTKQKIYSGKASDAASNIDRQLMLLQTNFRNEHIVYEDSKEKADKYELEIQKKYSIPFACFVFVLVGCPLGIRTKGGNFGISAAISLGFYVIYWGCLIGGEKLAARGYLSPFTSMWMADIVLGSLGILLCIKMNFENAGLKSLFRKSK